MSAWGNKDRANNSPLTATLRVNKSQTEANQTALYANTMVSAFIANEAVGVFGVDSTETASFASSSNRVAHSGWNMRTAGTGPVANIVLATAPTQYQYSNGFITFTGANTTPANAKVVADATGNVIDVILVSGGTGYVSTPTVVAAGSANNANLTFTITMGGRANRVQTETLAVISSFSANVAHGSLY